MSFGSGTIIKQGQSFKPGIWIHEGIWIYEGILKEKPDSNPAERRLSVCRYVNNQLIHKLS